MSDPEGDAAAAAWAAVAAALPSYPGSLETYREALTGRNLLADRPTPLPAGVPEADEAFRAGTVEVGDAGGELLGGWFSFYEPRERWWYDRLPADEAVVAARPERSRPRVPAPPPKRPRDGHGAVWVSLEGENSEASWQDGPRYLEFSGDERQVLAWARAVPAPKKWVDHVPLEDWDAS